MPTNLQTLAQEVLVTPFDAIEPAAESVLTRHPAKRIPCETSSEPTIALTVVRGFVRAAEELGAKRQVLQRATSLNLDDLEGDGRVPRSELHGIMEAAIDATGDPALGLHAVQRISPVNYGPVAHMIAYASDLRAALDGLSRFHRLLHDEPPFRMVEHEGKLSLRKTHRADEPPRVQRLSTEMAMLGLFRVVGIFGGACPELASFSYPAPSYADEYARAFEGRAQFDQPFTGVVFDASWLSTPSQLRDDELHSALHHLAERRLMRVDRRTPYALRVRELLMEGDSWRRSLEMPDAARLLGVSVRSLRRHLAREETTYTAVVNESLGMKAKELLRRQSIQETAYAMGFSDASAFHRAFKRWAGITPGAYQES